MAFQISLGVVAVAARNDGRDLDCGMLKFPVTPLAARREREACFPKVFKEIADFPQQTRKPTHFGQSRNLNLTPRRNVADFLATLAELAEAYESPNHEALPSLPPHEFLAAHLENIGMTATEWGKLIGIDRSTASRPLRGECKFNTAHVRKTAGMGLDPQAMAKNSPPRHPYVTATITMSEGMEDPDLVTAHLEFLRERLAA